MATIDIKTRDKLKPMMREMSIGDTLRVPFKRTTTNHLKVVANELKREEGKIYEVKSEHQVVYQLVTRLK